MEIYESKFLSRSPILSEGQEGNYNSDEIVDEDSNLQGSRIEPDTHIRHPL